MGPVWSGIMCCLQIQEYGVSMMCASHRRLACSDAQWMLCLHQDTVQDQLRALLERLANR